jgi:hypothetical protein
MDDGLPQTLQSGLTSLRVRYRPTRNDTYAPFYRPRAVWENLVAMIYVKAVGLGLLFAILVFVLSFLIITLAQTLYWWLVVLPRFQSSTEASFGGGTVVSISVAPRLAIAAVAFVSGVWWALRRQTA